MRKILIAFILFSFYSISSAQEIPIGAWQDHLSYSDAISVTEGNSVFYCASNSAVFIYDKSDQSIERLSLVNSLSDVGISRIKFNPHNNIIIVTYKNGNLDIIDENKNVTNISYIKNSNISGDKAINDIYLNGKIAYLSTGFGIVVLDTDKLEIRDTYYIGDFGGYVKVNSITTDTSKIYAATDEGVFFADKNNPNLANYNFWNKIPEFSSGIFSNIVYFAQHLFITSESASWESDTIYYNPSGVWQKFIPAGHNFRKLNVSRDHLLISYRNGVETYDVNLSLLNFTYTFRNQFPIYPFEAIRGEDYATYIADEFHGLIRAYGNWNNELIIPNSPNSSTAFNMDFINGELWTVSGGYGINLDRNLVNHKVNGEWVDLGNQLDNINGGDAQDMVSIAINPSNPSQVYTGSWRDGLFEFNNDNVTKIYTGQNSLLDSVFFGITAIGAMAFDNDNNLWVTSSFSANNPLAVKTASNTWYNYSFTGLTSPSDFYTDMIIDENSYKWFISPKQHKILIFDDNGTIDNPSDDRKISNSNFPGSRIESIVQDKDGEVWIGTDEGVAVFYTPSEVFDENIEAEQILIQQDGQTQILLESEFITTIAIDGANRKWIGTQNSGAYLMSQDGTEEIEHFTTENSPLFSNNILDIVIDPKTGEVYIGTEKGLISYKGTATEPDSDFENIFVYPNPVKPDFYGKIAIRGLVKDTDVRITDISGNIVYQTTSFGGQAIWDGNDMNGNRVQSGVYMVFNGSQDGTKKAAAKILFIN